MKTQYVSLAALLLLLCSISATAQSGSVPTSLDIDYTDKVWDVCTNENVDFSGTIHVDAETVIDAKGGVHIRARENYSNVTGIGEVTGHQYQLVGATNESVNARALPFETTFTQTVGIISQGSPPNDRMEVTLHVTVNANLQITAFVDHTVQKCN